MLTCKDLFEIPVYRLEENTYYHQMSEHIEKLNAHMQNPLSDDYLRKKYGGSWRHNEVIGFLRFYRYGNNQIRCTYWETDSKIKVRTRTKQFAQVSDSYCKESFSKSASNLELAKAMRNAVKHCEVRLVKKKRFLDKELFESTVDFIDWKSLLR